MAWAAAVAAGKMDPVRAFSQFIRDKEQRIVPQAGDDMTGFEWEKATPDSFAKDMADVLAAAGRNVKVPDGPDPVIVPHPPPPATAEALEWS